MTQKIVKKHRLQDRTTTRLGPKKPGAEWKGRFSLLPPPGTRPEGPTGPFNRPARFLHASCP